MLGQFQPFSGIGHQGGVYMSIYAPPVSVPGAQSRKNDAIPPK